MPRSLAALALLAACGTPDAPPDDEDPPRAVEFRSAAVHRAIDAASGVVRTRGLEPMGDEWRGFLVEHASDVRELTLRSGNCYVVLAAATAVVRELNLRLFDSDGGEVMRDNTSGALAALRFCPAQSGAYYLAVHASAGSGLFEVRSFRGPTGLEVRIDDVFGETRSADPETP